MPDQLSLIDSNDEPPREPQSVAIALPYYAEGEHLEHARNIFQILALLDA